MGINRRMPNLCSARRRSALERTTLEVPAWPWADRSRDWAVLKAEVERRGLAPAQTLSEWARSAMASPWANAEVEAGRMAERLGKRLHEEP